MNKVEQFNTFGCVSRCIIKLSEWHNKAITQVDFIAKFKPTNPQWESQCGILTASGIIDICRELKLCRHADSFRSYHKIVEILEKRLSTGVLLVTEKDLTDATRDLFHCSLIENHKAGMWSVWTPFQDGRDGNMEVTTEFLEKRLAHFLVLF